MRRLLFALPLIIGCGIVSGPSPADPTCAYLDQQHLAWTTVATVGGALGTTAGTVLPIVDQFVDPQDAKDWNLGLGITTAIGGGMSLLGTLMSGSLTQAWDKAGCSNSE